MRRSTALLVSVLLAAALVVVGSRGTDRARGASATPIMGRSVLIADQLTAWFRSTGRTPRLHGVSLDGLARIFVEEGNVEGVRGDVAFAQTIFETGFLQFSERFPPECHNYAGIGGTQERHCFPDARTGVRAQIQHLRAYGDPSVGETGTAAPLVDPRFDLVQPKGVAPTFEQLSGRWSPGEDYGEKVVAIYRLIRAHAGPTLRDRALGAPIVGASSPPDGGGVWLADSIGGVFGLGAPFHGSIPQLRASGVSVGMSSIVAMAATPSGRGYWLVDEFGGIFAFGDARFFGSIPQLRASGVSIGMSSIVAMAATPSGDGYWLVDEFGGIFAFGDARFGGSIPALLARGISVGNARVVAIVAASKGGYWLVDAVGGVFAFGGAPFRGSAAGSGLRFIDAVRLPDRDGYRVVSSDGGVIAYR